MAFGRPMKSHRDSAAFSLHQASEALREARRLLLQEGDCAQALDVYADACGALDVAAENYEDGGGRIGKWSQWQQLNARLPKLRDSILKCARSGGRLVK
jgi:hypothetical protein